MDRSLGNAVQPGGQVHTLAEAFNVQADAEYPWRSVLRKLSVPEWDAAWKGLVVDPDHVDALSAAMSDSAMATIMALHAAHPSDPDLTALKRFTAMKHAPKVSWKALCQKRIQLRTP